MSTSTYTDAKQWRRRQVINKTGRKHCRYCGTPVVWRKIKGHWATGSNGEKVAPFTPSRWAPFEGDKRHVCPWTNG